MGAVADRACESMRETGLLDQFARVFGSVEREFETLDKDSASSGTGTGPLRAIAAPSQVQVAPAQPASPTSLQRLGAIVGSTLGPLSTFGMVLLLTILILLHHTELRDRLLRLLGGNLHRSTDDEPRS